MLNKVHNIAPPESVVVREYEEKEGQSGSNEHVSVRVGRRSGIMNLIDFVRRHQIKRHHHHRKIVDLTQSVNAAEMAVIESKAKASSQNSDGSSDSGYRYRYRSGYVCGGWEECIQCCHGWETHFFVVSHHPSLPGLCGLQWGRCSSAAMTI